MTSSPPMADTWICEAVRQAVGREGSFNALEGAITKASARLCSTGSEPARARFDRRKLKSIAEGLASVSVSFDEWLMLDAYLTPFGQSLTHRPLLERPGPLQLISRSQRVEILLGARIGEHGGRTTMSDRDVLAMMEIQAQISRLGRSMLIGFQDVLVHASLEKTRNELDELFASLGRPGPASLVGVASSRVNSAVERMLADMHSVKEFSPTGHGDVPFHFVWPETGHRGPRSAFQLMPDEIPEKFSAAREAVAAGSRALIWGDGYRLAEPVNWDRSRDVGVICVQRRSEGQIWLVVAGLSGAGTIAAAHMVDRMDVWIPEPKSPTRHGDVVWAVVEIKLRQDTPETVMAIRRQVDPGFEVPPQVWTAS